MSIALYRKYRPKTFGEVSNQNHIKITLQNEIESDRVAHAYLFCGPRGTGKTTLARLLSKAVNCLDIKEQGEPCNACRSCTNIMDGKAMDIIEIDAASHTGVDNVRENIIQNARFTPTNNKFKVFIIDEVHMLSISAFNALLKILEEPPKHVMFILATTEAHKVPATIISRCQRFDFKKIVIAEIVERLKWIIQQEEVKVDDRVLILIAKHSGGCVRDAESLLEQVLSLGEKNISLEQAELIIPKADFDVLFQLFEFIFKKQTAEAVKLVNKLVMDGVDIAQFTDGFVEFTRKILLYKITGNLEELSREIEESIVKKIVDLAPNVVEKKMTDIIAKCLSAKELFKQNYITQLPLEMAVFDLTQSGVAAQNFAPAPTKQPPPPPAAPAAPTADFNSGDSENKPAADLPADDAQPVQSDVSPVQSEKFDINEINLHWPAILGKIKIINYPLYMSLRMAKPVSWTSETLVLGFLFELQKQKVEDIKCKSVLCGLLKEMFGANLEVETKVDPALTLKDLPNGESRPQAPATIEDSASNLANEFGGEVVD